MIARFFFLLPKRLRSRIVGNPFREHALCVLAEPRRLKLPLISLDKLFSDYAEAEITLSQLPKGAWASPVVDIVVMAKLVKALAPSRVLELGSFRGYTALAMAGNLPADGKIVAVDIVPDHGEAYAGRIEANRIERRVGEISVDLFAREEHGSYDLVFVDADHRYEAVKHDSELALKLVKRDGWIVWHDYANWGLFTGACGVPEYLDEIQKRLPVAHIAGSNMAIHSPLWSEDRASFDETLAATRTSDRDVWTTGVSRS